VQKKTPAAGWAAAGVARKWEGSVASDFVVGRPVVVSYRSVSASMPDKKDVQFDGGGRQMGEMKFL
jgi:hypothetical protein